MNRLALVVPSLNQGGGVRSVAAFVVEAAKRSGTWEVCPVSLCMSSVDPESVSLRRPGTWMRGVQVGRREWRGQLVPHVGAALGEIEFQRYRPRNAIRQLVADCDVIQVVCGSPAWGNVVTGLGKPVSLQVATLARVERRMRDGEGRGVASEWRRWMTRITDRLDTRALRAVDAIQLENPWMLEHTRQLNAERSDVDIRYAPPGVDSVLFDPAPERDVVTGPVLCVGRLDDPRKNVSLLLEAYAQLPSEMRARHHLVLAGAGRPPEAFWALAERLGVEQQVEFVSRPTTEQLVSLYRRAAVFALPSDEEGLGIVVLEAMACGVPTVCTRCGGPDGIVTDGVDGRLVPLADPTAMSKALGQVLGDPTLNRAMGRAARRTIEQRYALDVTARAFVETWDTLAMRGLHRE